MQASEAVSSLMTSFRAGDCTAGGKLIELLYPELKRLAAARLKTERQGHSWQPTLLVNELYLELSRVKSLRPLEKEYDDDKAAFLALAGLIMRRLLTHYSRYASQKAEKVPVSELPSWKELRADPEHDLLEVEDILQQLEQVDPRVRAVVEMKVFEGCTAEEIANRLGCAAVSVYRDWQFARHWLKTKL